MKKLFSELRLESAFKFRVETHVIIIWNMNDSFKN